MELNQANIKAVITYDGTPYLGFQKTHEKRGIEDFLQKALYHVTQKKVKIQGASRTDAKVHARCQVINFFLPKPLPLKNLKKALNANLPKTIRVRSLEKETKEFHPTLSSKAKIYRYYIYNHEIHCPFRKDTAWHIHHPLDITVMKKAATSLIGEHDFSAFATNGHHEDTIRVVDEISIEKSGCLITVTVKGKSFLYRMVRSIVGTLVYIGRGKLQVEDCKTILEIKDRKKAGPSAPAHGLFLYQIDY